VKLRRRRHNSFEESSASSDIAFLLIIYFLVIAGFNVNHGFIMNLPARNSTRLILKDDLLRMELDATGLLWHEGKTLDFADAEAEIGAAISAHPNLAVSLLIDPATPWQQVVSFVELAQKLRVEAFSFSMREGGA
jgi:biopolymer transport protein ExbD